MTTQAEALKMALEALDQLTNAADTFSVSGVYFNEGVWAKKCLSDAYFAITAIEQALAQPEQPKIRTGDCLLVGVCASEGHKIQKAQPAQEQNLKLMPREATPEMLKAMDECSTEGYDERLYEGHAGSVYMAAWDAFYGQHCYCGDITNLGVIHRDDGPCHYPGHKEPEQEPHGYLYKTGKFYHEVEGCNPKTDKRYLPLYTTPPQRKPLTDERLDDIYYCVEGGATALETWRQQARAIEAAHGIRPSDFKE